MSSRRTILRQATLAAATLGAAALAPRAGTAAGSAKGKGPDSPSGYVGQMQVTANVLVGNRPRATLQVDAGLFSADPDVRTSIPSYGPALRAAWRGTAQEFANRYLVFGRVPDSALLATHLQAATDRIIGRGKARVMMVAVIVR
jgi:hypothetical protein